MLISIALISGILMAALLTVLILGSLSRNPRVLISNGPKIMQETLPPLTAEEMRTLKMGRSLIIAIILLMPPACAILYESSYQELNYGEAVLFLWLIWMCYNTVDLVIIDWFVLLWWQPSWSQIPDAKPYKDYTDYRYHFMGFLKGTVMGLVFALFWAAILLLI